MKLKFPTLNKGLLILSVLTLFGLTLTDFSQENLEGRVGGGQNYSSGSSSGGGGGSSGSSGGGSGSGNDLEIAFYLIYHIAQFIPGFFKWSLSLEISGVTPIDTLLGFGIFLTPFIFLFSLFQLDFSQPIPGLSFVDDFQQEHLDHKKIQNKMKNFNSFYRGMEKLKTLDPNFSFPLFRDFVGLLAARFFVLRWENSESLAPFIEPKLWKSIAFQNPYPVKIKGEGVIIAGIHFDGLDFHRGEAIIRTTLEVNYTLNLPNGPTTRYETREFHFRRSENALTPRPQIVLALGCPACGETAQDNFHGNCKSCKTPLNSKNQGWILTFTRSKLSQEIDPFASQKSNVEQGTFLPSVKMANCGAPLRDIQIRDPLFFLAKMEVWVKNTFLLLQEAWSQRDWKPFRRLESDNLFRFHYFWLESLKIRKIYNRLRDIKVETIELCWAETDTFFDSLTFRIHASMIDEEVDEQGNALGEPGNIRQFSEYWNFIRSPGEIKSKKGDDPLACPNCGGELSINQEGDCDFCGSRVCSGEFDWVLSWITQDEEYAGG